ncbi:MAG TPA: LpqB family beta-propeller domain-containing protein, partial [Minicystis sp.]|nr:LpqB family beta-propeller domain-containing protein [Minicystis sp.]
RTLLYVGSPGPADSRAPALHILDLESRTERVLAPDLWTAGPAWLPDGRSVVTTVVDRAPTKLRVVVARVEPDFAVERTLYETNDLTSGTAVSRDGARVAFSILKGIFDGAAALYVMSTDGAGATKLGDGAAPTFSPDGATLLVTHTARDRRRHVFLVDARTGAYVRQVTAGTWEERASAFSPDGRRVAFVSCPPPVPGDTRRTHAELYVVGLDGTGLAPLTTGGRVDENGGVAWGDDGFVYFVSDAPDGRRGIWRVRAR